MLASSRSRNHGLGLHHKCELPGSSIGHEVRVVCRFVGAHVRLIDNLHAAEPLYVHVPLPTGNDEPYGISLLGAQRFAVLAVGDQHVVKRFLKRDAARHPARVCSLGNHPTSARFQAHLIEQGSEWHTSPFTATQKAMASLRIAGGAGYLLPATITSAFEEVNSRNRGQAMKVLHRENQRSFNQAVNHYLVILRIDFRYP